MDTMLLTVQFRKNITLIYLLTALHFSWFWIAIWVLFYLRFTNYAGIGLLESAMIITTVVGEIPTGAIADLLGKKKTLIISFVFSLIGFGLMGVTSSFFTLIIGVILATIGGTLISGTQEALIYDSLLTIKQETRYEKVLGNISTIKMLSLAIASIIGGYMYKINPGLPFLALAGTNLLAAILGFWLTEPPVDSYIFSWKNYIKQTKEGIFELFKSHTIKIRSITLIVLTMLVVMNGHVLIDAQLVAQGWNADQLGIITFAMFIISAFFGQLTSTLSKKFGTNLTSLFSALFIAISMIMIQYIGIIPGTLFIMLRNGVIEIFGNSASNTINSTTVSKYRATALSSYNMFSNIPYVLGAYGIGYLMDIYSVHIITAVLGFILLFVGIIALKLTTQQKNS